MSEQIELGQVGYEAYRKYAEGRSLVSGSVLPPWQEVKPGIREAWQISAKAIAEAALAAAKPAPATTQPQPQSQPQKK